MKKICLLVINSLMLLILLFSMVGCINNDGQSSKPNFKSYFQFCYAINDEHMTFGLDEDVTIELFYGSNLTRDDYSVPSHQDARLYVSSHPGGDEVIAEIARESYFKEMECLFVIEEFYMDEYPPIQYNEKDNKVFGEPTKILVLPKELFLYDAGKLLLKFSFMNGAWFEYVFYEKSNGYIHLKKTRFSVNHVTTNETNSIN